MHDPSCPGCAEPDLAFAPHDHGLCTASALGRAEAIARQNGVRLTPVRRRVLELLLESHRALGAYDILARLVAEGFGNQPPVAYRALDFLEQHGLAHRIRRLNAFVACHHMGEAHAPAFLVCSECGLVAEAPAQPLQAELQAAAQRLGFALEAATIEGMGLCPACRTSGASA